MRRTRRLRKKGRCKCHGRQTSKKAIHINVHVGGGGGPVPIQALPMTKSGGTRRIQKTPSNPFEEHRQTLGTSVPPEPPAFKDVKGEGQKPEPGVQSEPLNVPGFRGGEAEEPVSDFTYERGRVAESSASTSFIPSPSSISSAFKTPGRGGSPVSSISFDGSPAEKVFQTSDGPPEPGWSMRAGLPVPGWSMRAGSGQRVVPDPPHTVVEVGSSPLGMGTRFSSTERTGAGGSHTRWADYVPFFKLDQG